MIQQTVAAYEDFKTKVHASEHRKLRQAGMRGSVEAPCRWGGLGGMHTRGGTPGPRALVLQIAAD